jgi:hypothetical protein
MYQQPDLSHIPTNGYWLTPISTVLSAPSPASLVVENPFGGKDKRVMAHPEGFR